MNYRVKAVTAFCKLRRLQEANEQGYVSCVTCGKIMKWNQCDGGHLIPRRHRGTEIEPDNVWPQCISCNRFGNITIAEYAEALSDRIGWERINTLLSKKYAHQVKDYPSLCKHFQAQIRQIRKEKGL